MLDKRKELEELEKQIFYITEKNLELEQQVRAGQEAELKLIENRERLKDLMQDFIGLGNEVS